MEWDQISNRWAEMTHRLRSDRLAAPQDIAGQPRARTSIGQDGDDAPITIQPVIAGRELSPPSDL